MLTLKKTLYFLLRIGISLILLILLFKFQHIDIRSLLGNIKGADRPLLLAAFSVTLLVYLLCFYRWKMLLDASDIKPALSKLIVSFSGGIFFNVFLPSTIGGDVVRSLDLSLHTRKPKEVIATVLLDRLSGYAGIVVVASFSLLFGWKEVYPNKAVLLSIAIITGLLILILLALFNGFIFSKINALLRSPAAGRFKESLKNLHQELHYFKNRKGVLVKNLMLSLLVQIISPLATYITALALGININVVYFFVFYPVIAAITFLPIAVGGLGLRENMYAIFFRRAGVNESASVALSLVGFSITLIYAAIGGTIYVLTVYHRRLQRHPAPGISA